MLFEFHVGGVVDQKLMDNALIKVDDAVGILIFFFSFR